MFGAESFIRVRDTTGAEVPVTISSPECVSAVAPRSPLATACCVGRHPRDDRGDLFGRGDVAVLGLRSANRRPSSVTHPVLSSVGLSLRGLSAA